MVTLSELPASVIHNSESKDFTVPFNQDLNIAGIYQVNIQSEMFSPTSASDPTLMEVSATTSLEIVFVDPCKLT